MLDFYMRNVSTDQLDQLGITLIKLVTQQISSNDFYLESPAFLTSLIPKNEHIINRAFVLICEKVITSSNREIADGLHSCTSVRNAVRAIDGIANDAKILELDFMAFLRHLIPHSLVDGNLYNWSLFGRIDGELDKCTMDNKRIGLVSHLCFIVLFALHNKLYPSDTINIETAEWLLDVSCIHDWIEHRIHNTYTYQTELKRFLTVRKPQEPALNIRRFVDWEKASRELSNVTNNELKKYKNDINWCVYLQHNMLSVEVYNEFRKEIGWDLDEAIPTDELIQDDKFMEEFLDELGTGSGTWKYWVDRMSDEQRVRMQLKGIL